MTLYRTVTLLPILLTAAATGAEPVTPSTELENRILARIKTQEIAGRSFVITDYGAKTGAACTDGIHMAISACRDAGGGTVVVPEGVFVSGAIFLKPGVNLRLAKGAVLKASTDMKDFPERRVRIEGHFEERFSVAFINADGCDGLRIDGEGTLDGSGRPAWDRFWAAMDEATKSGREFDNLETPRPQLCLISNSKNVAVEGVTFKDSAFWNLHLYNCSSVLVRNARFQVPDDVSRAPSTDGIDVDSCQDVVIDGCTFSVTDDCVCLKGNRYDGLDQEPKSPPVKNVLVKNCTFLRGDGAFVLGTEAQGISDAEMRDCVVRGEMPMLRMKLRADTPNQDYRNISVRNVRLEDRASEIVVVSPKHGAKVPTPEKTISTISGILIENISGKVRSFGTLSGGAVAKVGNVTLRNIDVKATGRTELNTEGVSGLKLENVSVRKAR